MRLVSARYCRSILRWMAVAAWVAPLVAALPASAEEAFLRIQAITVGAGDENHDEWVNLLSIPSLTVKSSDPGSAAERTKKVRYEDITVVKELDKASPKLMEYCARGWAVPSAMVDFVRKPGGAAYATLHLDRVLITSYHIVARNPDDQPTEQVTLKFGSASLSATDQGETGVWETTFDVTSGILSTLNVNRIGPTGKPPRFNPIPTQILNFGAGVNSFEFEIGDEDTPLSELTFTARSDLPALFPPSAFQFSGIGPRRRLTIAQPKAGTVPTMRVAVEVSDGTHTATYYVVVATGDDSSPAIAFSPKPLAEHSPAGTVAGTFSLDPATPGATFALIDTASGRFRIEGDELLVDDPLLLDYESDPNPEITVESDAGTGSVATVSVPIQDIPEGPYDLWLADQFTPSQLLDPNISGPFADFDKDGLNTLAEYGTNNPPTSGTNPHLPQTGKIEVAGQEYLAITFWRVTADTDPSLSVDIQITTDYKTWLHGAPFLVPVSATDAGPGIRKIVVRSSLPFSELADGGARIRVRR